ncbi:MAG: redoxin domain-containing protein [Candidatus Hydrogenedentes bacterium]|nr:redoxin domain-containing protein [Candidatus Hydrogenedentota bacterium]
MGKATLVRRTAGAALVMTALLVVSGFATAQDGDGAAARTMLEKAMADTAGLDSLSFDLLINARLVRDGEPMDRAFTGNYLLRGENDLYHHLKGKDNDQEIEIYSRGGTHFIHLVDAKKYDKIERDIPRSRLMAGLSGGMLQAPTVWLSDFVHNNPELFETEKISPAAAKEIDGTACDGVRLEYEGFEVTAWLAPGETRVLREFTADLAKSIPEPEAGKEKTTVLVTFTLSNWQPNIALADDKFTFTPPEGVTLNVREEPEGALKKGAPAPDFTLPLLGGGEVKLSTNKGKVVILDFWASWCGPCRQAMPIVDKVAHEMADQGVLLYAVNLREDEDRIRTFLDSQKLKTTVLLDKEGDAAEDYGVESIPMLVVVDPKGNVSEIFQGVGPDLETDLRNALKAALEAGK